jgi:hypothetical protein
MFFREVTVSHHLLRRRCEDFFFIIHLFTCVYIVWVISPTCPSPPPSPPLLPSLPGRTCSALVSNFVEEKT